MITDSKLTNKRIAEYLAGGKRFDGRKPEEFRDIEIDVNLSKKAEGGAKVRIGETEVWVGVKMSVGTPYDDSPDQGNLMVTSELTPLSHQKYEYGPPKFPTIELGRLVDRGIRESGFLDLKKLCIVPGEAVWNIFIDVYSINDAGNLLDAAFIGALAALKSAKVPKYDEEKKQIDYDAEPASDFPLTDKLPLNFSVYKIGDSILLDPSYEEEMAADGRLILAVIPGEPFKICSMQKSHTMDLSTDEFGQMLDMVSGKYDDFMKVIVGKIDSASK
tara:strand:+ start:12118 stop:12939 length:822 start_codon:yes stop_codon:yes gene_type:complete